MTEKIWALVPYDCQDGKCLMIWNIASDSKLGALSLDHKDIGEGIIEELNKLENKNKDIKDYVELVEESIELLKKVRDNLKRENNQLKKDVEYWKQVASQYSNELNVFEHIKKYKTECKGIHSSKGDGKSCGFCKHCQLDGMFGMWCDIHETFYDAENCPNYER